MTDRRAADGTLYLRLVPVFVVALVTLRVREPGLARPFRVPGGAISVALAADGWVVVAGDRDAVRMDRTSPDAARLVALSVDITDEGKITGLF